MQGAHANILTTTEGNSGKYLSPVADGYYTAYMQVNGTAACCDDADGQLATGVLSNGYSGSAPKAPGTSGSEIAAKTGRHSDGANYLACDGHVKWLRGSQVTGVSSAASPTTPATSDAVDGTAVGQHVLTSSPT